MYPGGIISFMARHVPILLFGAVAAVLSACATSQANVDSATAAEIRAIRAQSVAGDKVLLFPGERRLETISPSENPLWLLH
jgi:hypothetical protein